MARFFIDHSVFAMVIAVVIVLLGGVAILTPRVANYPDVVPPAVQVTANFLGGNAQDLEKTVTELIEEPLIGLDGLFYSLSSAFPSQVSPWDANQTHVRSRSACPEVSPASLPLRFSLVLPNRNACYFQVPVCAFCSIEGSREERAHQKSYGVEARFY